MMRDDLISDLHRSPWRGVLAITGGGSGAIERLLSTPGASATVLEAIVPYSAASLTDWLRHEPQRACDESTARAIAMRAFERASSLAGGDADPRLLFGLGCTASLASDRPKRGEHRAHLAVQTSDATRIVSLRFEKGRRTRAEEEQAVSHAAVATLAAAAGLHELDLSKTPPGIEATTDAAVGERKWTELLLGQRAYVALPETPLPGSEPVCLLPGSFNPPHAGHAELARLAGARTGRTVVRELSITNVDKPPLDYFEVRKRLAALNDEPTWLTRAPTFVEKARLAPGAVFAVGADTAQRIGEGRYYRDEAARDDAIDELSRLGCRLLVFGREIDGRFVTLEQLELPPALAALCEGVSELEFRIDVSSTDLRA